MIRLSLLRPYLWRGLYPALASGALLTLFGLGTTVSGADSSVSVSPLRAGLTLPVSGSVPSVFARSGLEVTPRVAPATTHLARTGEGGPVGNRWEQQLGGEISSSGANSYNRSAILTSLLLPGLAQYRLGEKERGLAFMAVELAAWTGFAAYRIQGENREESYVEMAELFAGISPNAPRDEDFYKTLAGWPSSDLYNEIVVRRLARTAGGDDIEARAAYYEENRVQGDETWAWDSEVARSEFREKRTDAQRSFKRSRYMVGLTVVNRVVAMIDATLLSGRKGGSNYGLEMTQTRDGSEYAARLGLRRTLP